MTYKSPDGREEFVDAIGRLSANGGGDCPELAIKGMLDAFKPEPQIGSPMFVFTDATPKDATTSNIDTLKWYVPYIRYSIILSPPVILQLAVISKAVSRITRGYKN